MPDATFPLIIGHRGSCGYRPEHSAASFLLAIEQGADAIEPDVVVSQDGVLLVRHENEISGTTDVAARPEFADRRTTKVIDGEQLTGWFTEDFTWAELATLRCSERLPELRPENTAFDGDFPLLRLRDVLALAAEASDVNGLRVVIELKHAHYFAELGFELIALLREDLAATGWDRRLDRVIVESFELGILDRMRETGWPTQLVFLMESEGTPADERARDGDSATRYAEYRADAGLDSLRGRVDGVSFAKAELFERDQHGVTTGISNLVARSHQRGLLVFSWTFRPENAFLNRRVRSSGLPAARGDWLSEYALALSTGLDGMFVDHVDLGCSARERFMSAGGPRLDET